MNDYELNKKRKRISKFILKTEINNLLNDPHICYALGYIYADGHVGNSDNYVSIEIADEDMYFLKNCLDKISNWTYTSYTPLNKKHKIKTRALTGNKEFRQFLVDFNFINKSKVSPINLFNSINVNLQKYFIRGFLDGDGSIYISKKNKVAISFYSTYENDWLIMDRVFKTLNIKGYIYKHTNSKGRYSDFRTSKIKDVITLGDFIYDNFEQDNIGLPRKYEKFKQIKQYSLRDKSHPKKRKLEISKKLTKISTEKIFCILELRKQGYTIMEISSKMNVSTSPISNIINRNFKYLYIKEFFEKNPCV